MSLAGGKLLHEVAVRTLVRYLEHSGADDVRASPDDGPLAEGVDIVYATGGVPLRAKVKADPYFGTAPGLIADRSLGFYRADTQSYALEALSDTTTREPGWMQRSDADELYYYRLAIAQPESDVAALLYGPDEVFFAELAVERDELRIVPMLALRAWFAQAYDRYMPRPVIATGRPAWYRIIPSADLDHNVPGIRVIGPVYRHLGESRAE